MTAVEVVISPKRPLLDSGPTGGKSYFTRPVLAACPPLAEVTTVADMDDVMGSARCSCSAGDDVPF